MKACFLVIAAVSAVEPPVISLDLSTLQLHSNTSMWSGESSIDAEGHSLDFDAGQTTNVTYGVKPAETNSILYQHARITDSSAEDFEGNQVTAHRDLTLRCAADEQRDAASCVLPEATASDHHDGALSVKSRIYHIRDNDGTLVTSQLQTLSATDGAKQNDHGWHCESSNCITQSLTRLGAYTKRGSWLIRYDAKDDSGNRAEQLVVALTLDDHTKPEWAQTPISASSMNPDQYKCPLQGNLKAWEEVAVSDVLCVVGSSLTSDVANDNVDTPTRTDFDVTDTTRYDVNYDPSYGDVYVGDSNPALQDSKTAAQTAYDNCGADCAGQYNFCEDCTAAELTARLDVPRTKTGQFSIKVKIHDHAGVYGVNGQDNKNSYMRTVVVADDKPPTITLRTNSDVDSSQPDCLSAPGKNSNTPNGAAGECCANSACSEVYQQCGYVYEDNFATVQDDFDDHCSDLNAQAALNSDRNLTDPIVGFPVVGYPEGSYERLYECMNRTTKWTYLSHASINSSGLVNGASADTTGDYSITFSTKDNNMNDATDVTRIVHVIDTAPPTAQLYPPGVHEVVHFASSGNPTDFKKYGSGSRADAWMNPDSTCEMSNATFQSFEDTKELNTTALDGQYSCSEPGIVCYDFCDSKPSGNGGEGQSATDLLVTAKWTEFYPHEPSGEKQTYTHGMYGVSRTCNQSYPCEYDDRVVGKWVREYKCEDRSGNTHTITRNFVNADKEAPYIVLNDGANQAADGQHIARFEAVEGAVYTEPGARCTDWHRHDMYDPNEGIAADSQNIIDTVDSYNVHNWSSHPNQAHLVITQVDPTWPHTATCTEESCPATNIAIPGTYVMKYTCTDHAGNEADPKFRTVVVVDDMKPVIYLKNDTSKCDPPHECTVEAGFKFVDPGIDAMDENEMGSLGAGLFPLRNVSLSVTFDGSADENADGHGGIKELLDTMDPVMGTGATLRNPQVGEYVLTYDVEDFWHTDTVTQKGCSVRQPHPQLASNNLTCSMCSGYSNNNGITCNDAVPVKRTLTVTDTLRPVITLHDADNTLNPFARDGFSEPFHVSDASPTGVRGVQNPAGESSTVSIAGAYPDETGTNPNISLMVEQASYFNGWVAAGMLSAVAGVALLVQGNKKATSVPV